MIYEQGKDRYRVGKTFISVTTLNDVQERIAKAVDEGMNAYVCVSNPRTINLASRDAKYREVMDRSLMNTPDGEPTVWAARLWGLKNVKRAMGPLMFQQMLENPSSGLKHFLLGDTDETLEKIKVKAAEKGALIVGTYSPPFCSLEEYDYEGIAKMINESGADIVWTAMRAPKQDYFDVNLLTFLDKKICIGVGAALRFYLGEYKMAPPIIKKLGLMGLYWGSKGQPFLKFLWNYFLLTLRYDWHLMKIPFRRMIGKKYYE